MNKLVTPQIFHDQPLDPASRPEDVAAFYFNDYANTFARLVADRNTQTPLVLGISGQWGTGKTTLLKQIRAKLDETRQREKNANYSFLGDDSEGDFRQCRTVWFNAWKYAAEDELLVALVRVIVQAMAADDAVSNLLGKLNDPTYPRRDVIATVLGWFSLSTPVGEVKLTTGEPHPTRFGDKTALLDLFSDYFDKLLAAWVHRKSDIEQIDPTQGVLVVFVDDLDRCLPEQTVQVLEAIKLFLDRRGVVFVLAADEAVVQAAVEARYAEQKIAGQRASDYLEKIFQVRFVLPPISEQQATHHFLSRVAVSNEQARQSLEVALAGSEVNPRQIKTFLNYLAVGWAVLSNSGQAHGVEQADFIRWLALTRVGAQFCDRVRELPGDRRLDYIADAVRWAADPTYKSGEYQEWAGSEFRRLRSVLKLTAFSSSVTAEVLNGFIFWSAPDALPPTAGPGGADPRVEARSERGRLPQDEREWVVIPAGKFVMGSRDENPQAYDSERPQHTVDLPDAYRIARYPVTNAQFKEFATAEKLTWTTDRPDDHPVAHVEWGMAVKYCEWLTRRQRQAGTLTAQDVIRLPTEAEWEKAARGEYGKEYPWGEAWDPARCNSAESGIGTTTPVGQYSPLGDSPYGVADMVGNVWEWTQSLFRPYPYQAEDGREAPDENGARVLRGGSFFNFRGVARCACRRNLHPDFRGGNFGFRVVVVSPGSRS